ncbi:response regulator transcription factor [Halanaerobacter jeridensis]|uniref:Stage 0 sporulation protein A homolog n=1 Tax=Halanaerobacter jeridensis TaxID=706427 RepID=A0A938XTN2_9FIRM|nr:response regulator transcription factor [Halanaerobacter jeridensis]MBM7557328.1 DNA-binding response OmpR family regulator [Halanaerobacter jeridensis]
MASRKVLIIDDDQNICKILKEYLVYEDFDVVTANSGQDGLKKIESEVPDLIILDIMLPEMDGWEICQELRPENDIPIIMLSAKTKDTDKIMGLELGADDYVTKPFSPKEVVSRVKAVLRRSSSEEKESSEQKILSFPELEISKSYRSVEVKGEEISLTPKEFDLLLTLASSPRQVFSREKLLNKVWGYDYYGDDRTVDTHIKSLRQKLGDPVRNYIETVWGVGYKFEV